MRTREPWYESDNPDRIARAASGRIALWFLLSLLFFGALGVGIWGFKVATSDIKGQGDATRIKNDARNRIRAQEGFEKLYADIVASDRKIDVADSAAEASPDDRTLRQNASGVRQYCISVVGEYNAKARSYSAEDFRAADLPYQIDSTTQTSDTDCKGSNGK